MFPINRAWLNNVCRPLQIDHKHRFIMSVCQSASSTTSSITVHGFCTDKHEIADWCKPILGVSLTYSSRQ